MSLHEIYFWTDTIKDWKNLLAPDKYKLIITNTLQQLHQRNLINVFGFVIMPNHLHILWQMLRKNGKEMPHASFNKTTAHLMMKDLKINHPRKARLFKVCEPERQYRVWQRDPLAVWVDSREGLEKTLHYIHVNPLQEHWNLADRPEWYEWSSASFYELGKSQFDFLTDYREVF